jgi:hypothetical protein
MKRLVKFPLEGGGEVLIEVDDPGGIARAGLPDAIETATQSFEAALRSIKPAADILIDQLRNLAKTPDEIEMEFGIKLGAKAGAIFTSADAEANFAVTLKWIKANTK